jgi:hypothetical protein
MEHHGTFTRDRARAIGEEIGIDWSRSPFGTVHDQIMSSYI